MPGFDDQSEYEERFTRLRDQLPIAIRDSNDDIERRIIDSHRPSAEMRAIEERIEFYRQFAVSEAPIPYVAGGPFLSPGGLS